MRTAVAVVLVSLVTLFGAASIYGDHGYRVAGLIGDPDTSTIKGDYAGIVSDGISRQCGSAGRQLGHCAQHGAGAGEQLGHRAVALIGNPDVGAVKGQSCRISTDGINAHDRAAEGRHFCDRAIELIRYPHV